ncbi:hypothetical protein [Sinorhizobium meliloti]|uniref:hypothetical protein n=1 Tax=Rhizobium meliloti TaxID=382 RepID=UPI0013E28DB8|nr:hypothetical protein [Sinorhizobium meliloti]
MSDDQALPAQGLRFIDKLVNALSNQERSPDVLGRRVLANALQRRLCGAGDVSIAGPDFLRL